MRTSVVLGVIAAALLAFILIFERGTLSSGELEKRQGSVLPELVRARVSKIEIQRKGVTTALARELDAEEDEMALWRVDAPFKATADREAVDTLLGELEWLQGARRLEHLSAEDRKRFGLDAPRYRLWFTVGSERIGVTVGNETPTADGVYVQAGQPDTAFVVGKDFAETLDHDPEHYHSKILHDGVLFTTARALILRDGDASFTLRRRPDGLWNVVEPALGLASNDDIIALLDALDGLRASRFVAADVKDLARYGLEPARRELKLMKVDLRSSTADDNTPKSEGDKAKSAEKAKAPEHEVLDVRLRVGAPCEGHAGESYVVAGESGATVMCALDADLDKLVRTVDSMRSKRMLPLEASNVEAVKLERGTTALALAKTDDGWSYTLTRGGKTVVQGNAREGSVNDWLEAVRNAEATSLQARTLPSTVQGSEWKATFTRSSDLPAFTLRIAMDSPSEGAVQRFDEPSALPFSLESLELLEPSAARFRSLVLVDAPQAPLEKLELRRADGVERAERKAAGEPLRVVAPLEADADRIATADLSRLLSHLEAVRFVSDQQEPEHGLAAPALTAHVTLGAEGKNAARTLVLRVGHATENGRFAALDGTEGVFVIASQLADLLSAPLVSRSSLATPVEQLRSAELVQNTQRLRIEKSADGFTDPSGALTPEQASRLASALATARAQSVVGYGPALPSEGFAKPTASVHIELASGTRYTVELGANTPDGGRYARRSDLAVRFGLPESTAQAWLSALPKP